MALAPRCGSIPVFAGEKALDEQTPSHGGSCQVAITAEHGSPPPQARGPQPGS